MGILVYSVLHLNHTIQQQRIDLITRDCRNQNIRHDKAIAAIDRLIKKAGVPKAKRKAMRTPSVIIINAMLPKVKDCHKLAIARIHYDTTSK